MRKWKSVFVVSIASVLYACTTALHPLHIDRVHPAELELMRGIVADSLLDSPQFHDFQRTIIGRPGQNASVGALVIASPIEMIDTLDTSRWWNVAAVLVEREDSTIKDSGLTAGTNCYYMQYRGNIANPWMGRLANLGAKAPCPGKPPAGARTIFVTPNQINGDVPFAVRIHITAPRTLNQRHLPIAIGVPCDRQWCSLHFPDIANWPPLPGLGNKNAIPGWHDEQILTYESGGRRIPSTVRARITPVETLDNIVIGPDWQVAAEIIVDGTDPKALADYQRKWRMPNYNWERNVSLSLRKDGAGNYFARYATKSDTSVVPIRVIRGATRRFVNTRESRGMMVEVASTARWSIDSDGGSWIRCDDGCCTVT
jgi:hypothetical protein